MLFSVMIICYLFKNKTGYLIYINIIGNLENQLAIRYFEKEKKKIASRLGLGNWVDAPMDSGRAVF